jgi:hypothetical protein
MLKAILLRRTAMDENQSEVPTQHAMLVVWGLYAQAIGLIRALAQVPLPQKTVDYSPHTKLLEFLLVILAGLEHLQDLSEDAEPIVKDRAVAQAWQQPGWAHPSGVSRTLQALSLEQAHQVGQVLEQVEQPLLNQEVMLALASQGKLVLAGDLTPRQVSSTSTTFPGSAFGYMEGQELGQGYQSVEVCLRSPTYGRLLLSCQLRPGDTVSNTQLESLVRAAEARLGLHPYRRTALLRQRLEQQDQHTRLMEQRLTTSQQGLQRVLDRLADTDQQLEQLPPALVQLEAAPPAHSRPDRPFSQLNRLRHRLEVLQRLRQRLAEQLPGLGQKLELHQRQWTQAVEAARLMREHLEQLEHENAANPFPIPVVFRLDAGFGSRENVAWLIEMGYEVYTRPFGSWLLSRLKQKATGRSWQRVGKNAEMVVWKQVQPHDFPYPLDLALERFYTGEKLKQLVLLHFGADPVTNDPAGWFHEYNRRQTIEAGIKEGKGTFVMRYLKVRSPAGLYLQEQFARFAANFVRYATGWLAEQGTEVPNGWTDLMHPQVKQQVKVGAHTSASICWQEQGCLLRFTDHSVFAGRSLQVSKQIAFQLALPFSVKVQT